MSYVSINMDIAEMSAPGEVCRKVRRPKNKCPMLRDFGFLLELSGTCWFREFPIITQYWF